MKNNCRLLVILSFFILIFCSCSKQPQSTIRLSITGSFEKEGVIFARLWDFGYRNGYYTDTIKIKGSNNDQSYFFTIADSILKRSIAIEIILSQQGSNKFSLRSIEFSNISKLESMSLSSNINLIYDNTTYQINNEDSNYLSFYSKNDSTNIVSFLSIRPYTFYVEQSHLSTLIRFCIFLLCVLCLYISSFQSINHLKFIVGTIILYIFTLPLKISWTNWSLAILSFFILIRYIQNRKWQIGFSHPVFYIISAIYIIVCLGVLHSPSPKAIGKVLYFSILPLFPILLSIILLHKNHIKQIFIFYVTYILAYCLLLISNLCCIFFFNTEISFADLIKNTKELAPYFLLYPSFTHPSFISIIISMAIPIAIYLKARKEISWLGLILSILLISTIVFLSGARIGLVVVSLLLILSFLFYIKIPQYIKYIIVGVGCILAFILFSNSSIKEKFKDPIRQDLRTTAITAIKEKPLFGWGTDSMETLLRSEDIAKKAGLEKPIAAYNHFHNQYLDMLVQFGFIGSIPFFALFAYLIFLAIKKKDFLLMAYLAIYLPFMWVESPFATAKGIQPMIFWLCFLVSTQKVRLDNEAVTPHPKVTSIVEDG